MAVSGSGDSLGRALLGALAAAAGGTIGVRRSYTAKGWHAQLSKLTSSDRGYQAAERAGLSATARTLKNWLSDPEYPIRRGDREKIAAAYGIMRGEWPAQVERGQFAIRGEVKIGSDRRDRGGNGTAAFAIDGREGTWSRMRHAWENGETDDDEEWEDMFVEDVIEADLGESSEPFEFPGGSYTVTIS